MQYMLDRTAALQAEIRDLGTDLGFHAEMEVSNSLLAVGRDTTDHYTPRIDVLWSLRLTDAQRQAIAWATGSPLRSLPDHLPVAGWEVEGTKPSTKTLTGDAANLLTFGAPFGFLLVNDDPRANGERGIYVRAARMLRTLRHQFGSRMLCPLDASWVDSLRGLKAPRKAARNAGRLAADLPRPKPGGGEQGDWVTSVRRQFREQGEAAGFLVEESWTTPAHAFAFDTVARGRANGFFDIHPSTGTKETITKAGKMFTASEIDLVWHLPLPTAFANFAAAVSRHDPSLAMHGLLDVDAYGSVAVLACEFETSKGKHAGGGLLNLARHGLLGLMATNSAESAKTIERIQPDLSVQHGAQQSFCS